MSDFTDRQAALDAARSARARRRRELFTLEERLRRLRRRRREVERRAADDAAGSELAALARDERELSRQAADLGRLRDEAERLVLDHEIRFEAFSDPRENLARLDDRYPILLFPVRIETRFKQLERADGPAHQLWVRVYPDDVAVDTFEDMLAEVEVTNARIYWTNVWKAGGDEGELRAAWRSLVKSHGAGRARWILDQYAPAAEPPVKAAGQHLLVIVTDDPPPAAEKPAVAAYWRAVFLAGRGDTGRDDDLAAAFSDLAAALGQARAEAVVAAYEPQNLTAPVADPAAVEEVVVELLELPPPVATQEQPWMRAASTALLPERFVVLGFNGGEETLHHVGRPVPSELAIGPSPTAAPDEQLRLEDGELVVPDELRWMVDFDQAVDKGMAFRIDLTPLQARAGFDRLFVLGVRLSADPHTGSSQLESLIRNHQRSRKGFSILPQGAPTNNVEDQDSGYTWVSDSDASYDHYALREADREAAGDELDPADWRTKRDGRWLAEYLGIDREVLKESPGYYSTDQCEARALNGALWPATLGYFMERMMEPVFAADTVGSTRAYFRRYVLGRGAVPAIRIGAQPYGILPATPYSRIAWMRRELLANERVDTGVPNAFNYLNRLYSLVLKADETWSRLAGDVSYVGKPGVDPQQALLDVVGLHPSSVELYQRWAESAEQLYNRFKLSGSLGGFLGLLVALGYVQSGVDLLAELGHVQDEGGELPEILTKFFFATPNLLKGPLIDDRPLSESEPIRAYRGDGSNYLEWLIAAARESHDTLRRQQGFLDDRPPTALLYLMLRHALDIGYVDTALQLHLDAGLLAPQQVTEAKRQTAFIHVQEAAADPGSEWRYLYKADAQITGHPSLRVAEFVPTILELRNPYLNTQIQALEHLAGVPTARLERAFAEHVDCCTYRLDAWWLGLVHLQLSLMRTALAPGGRPPIEDVVNLPGTAGGIDGGEAPRGIYLGSYGWLEDLRPQVRRLRPVELDDELAAIFDRPGQPPLEEDSSNFGHIHAPSLNHAVTAAVLRNGYLSNATPDDPGLLSINLTSERVRLALGVIEGIRNGQSLAALLGYRLERGLHDHEGLFLDSLIFELRRKFPLAGNRLRTTRTDPSVRIDAVEARNVVDGLALVEHVQGLPPGGRGYPFGLAGELPEVTDPAALAAIDAEVDGLLNLNDAVADLAMAEGVHQIVQGNYDRAASVMDAYSKGHFPPIPEVVQTPRSGVTLTHRVAIHLTPGLDPAARPTPRSKGEPAIDAWLADRLPPLDRLYVGVEVFHPATGTTDVAPVTAADLGLSPADLLYLLNTDGEQMMRALDDRVERHALATLGSRADAEVRIYYRGLRDPALAGVDFVPPLVDPVPFFEMAPWLDDLRALLLRSRPLRATDARLANEASAGEEANAAIRAEKVVEVDQELAARTVDLDNLAGDLAALLDDPDPEVVAANAVDHLDASLAAWVEVAASLSLFGLAGTGFGFAYDWRRKRFAALLAKLVERIAHWQLALADFEQRLVDYAALPATTSDEQKTTFLLQAAMLITTETVTPPASGDPDDLLTLLETTHKPTFEADLATLEGHASGHTEVGALYRAMLAAAPRVAAHDTAPLELAEDGAAILSFMQSLRSKADRLAADVAARREAAGKLLAGDPEAGAADRVEELTQAAKQLLGEDFVILPELTVGADHAAEWAQAFAGRAGLLAFLQTDAGVDFPVDGWLYGIARVREKMRRLESATMFGEALDDRPLELVPLQFPRRDGDSWLALRFPETADLDEDKLLYTAHYADFNATHPVHCGVLVDEWTEVIPKREETTGLAFHYDRPNCEPPQTLLLVTPAEFTGSWRWQDLTDTLHETLQLARKRGVEPQHVDDTAYARFLPATLSSVTRFPIALALNLAFNNAVQFEAENP